MGQFRARARTPAIWHLQTRLVVVGAGREPSAKDAYQHMSISSFHLKKNHIHVHFTSSQAMDKNPGVELGFKISNDPGAWNKIDIIYIVKKSQQLGIHFSQWWMCTRKSGLSFPLFLYSWRVDVSIDLDMQIY